MDYLKQLLAALMDNPERSRQLFVLIIGVTVFIAALSFLILIGRLSDPLKRRLQQISDHQQPPAWSPAPWEGVLQSISPYILPRKDWERSKASMKLVHAGFRYPNALAIFYVIKIAGVILLPLLALLATPLLPDFDTHYLISLVAVAGFVGLVLPDIIVERLIQRRRRLLLQGLPDAIDLLVVCTEAGLGLNAAWQRVADELTVSHPELADELALVNAELRLGVDRSQALKNLAKRTNLREIQGLVAALAQSMRLGTDIADTLRIYSEEFRDKRMQQAEEAAAKIGVKIIFPTAFCIWPSFFVVAIGPAIMRVLAVFHK